MVIVEFERISDDGVLINKEVLEKLIQIARQFDDIVISEVRNKHQAKRGSLRGIWEDSQISDELFTEARRALFSYEEK